LNPTLEAYSFQALKQPAIYQGHFTKTTT